MVWAVRGLEGAGAGQGSGGQRMPGGPWLQCSPGSCSSNRNGPAVATAVIRRSIAGAVSIGRLSWAPSWAVSYPRPARAAAWGTALPRREGSSIADADRLRWTGAVPRPGALETRRAALNMSCLPSDPRRCVGPSRERGRHVNPMSPGGSLLFWGSEGHLLGSAVCARGPIDALRSHWISTPPPQTTTNSTTPPRQWLGPTQA